MPSTLDSARTAAATIFLAKLPASKNWLASFSFAFMFSITFSASLPSKLASVFFLSGLANKVFKILVALSECGYVLQSSKRSPARTETSCSSSAELLNSVKTSSVNSSLMAGSLPYLFLKDSSQRITSTNAL